MSELFRKIAEMDPEALEAFVAERCAAIDSAAGPGSSETVLAGIADDDIVAKYERLQAYPDAYLEEVKKTLETIL